VCLLLVLGVLGAAWARQSLAQGLPQHFVAAYRPALEGMKKAYGTGTIEGTMRFDNLLSGTSLSRRFVYRAAGDWFRMDTTPTAQTGLTVKLNVTEILLATPTASMQGYQRPDRQLANANMKEISYDEARARVRDVCPLSFPYSMGTQGTILDMLQSGGTKVTSFKTGKLDGEPMIQITYEQQVDPNGRYGPWKCTLHISPDEGYALRSFSRTSTGGQPTTVRGTLSYDVDINGIPLMRSLAQRTQQGGSVTERLSVSISNFDTARPDLNGFRADGIWPTK
jgi:hypothetical protein